MILYFGNVLSATGNNPSFIELLAPRLNTIHPTLTSSTQKNKILRLADMIWFFLKHRRKCKVVLIDTYSYQGFYFAWIISVLCRFFSRRYIPIIRGGDFVNRMKNSPRLASYFLKNADLVIAPSEYMFLALKDRGVNVRFVPNFIEIGDYPFKSRAALQPRLFWVRSFHKIYNPSLAITIVAILKEKFPGVHLCMVGPDKDGTLEQCRSVVASKSLHSVVTFTGKLSKEKIREMSAQYDFFINTTTIDNHPVSVIEAMALGLVVITTNVGGIPYLVSNEREGILVPSGDANAFVKAIENLMQDRELARSMQLQAREKVEKYDWKEVRRHWEEILNPYFSA